MIKFVSRLLKISDADGIFTKKEDDYLIVGRNDKNIGVMSNGILTLLNPSLTIDSSVQGNIKIPTDNGDFIVQWGKANVQANSTTTFDFPVPFPNTCFRIIGSHEENDTLTSLMIKSISNTQFTITVVGGEGIEIIAWIAVGN